MPQWHCYISLYLGQPLSVESYFRVGIHSYNVRVRINKAEELDAKLTPLGRALLLKLADLKDGLSLSEILTSGDGEAQRLLISMHLETPFFWNEYLKDVLSKAVGEVFIAAGLDGTQATQRVAAENPEEFLFWDWLMLPYS